MLNTRNTIAIFIAMLIAMAFSASAQWSPGGSMVYMGDLNLALSSLSGGKEVQAFSSPAQPMANNTSINATSIEDLNATGKMAVLLPAGSGIGEANLAADQPATPASSGKKVLDLSGYSRDRINRNLAGYTNIMYPISGSRGSTTSTSGGGGCGGGCG